MFPPKGGLKAPHCLLNDRIILAVHNRPLHVSLGIGDRSLGGGNKLLPLLLIPHFHPYGGFQPSHCAINDVILPLLLNHPLHLSLSSHKLGHGSLGLSERALDHCHVIHHLILLLNIILCPLQLRPPDSGLQRGLPLAIRCRPFERHQHSILRELEQALLRVLPLATQFPEQLRPPPVPEGGCRGARHHRRGAVGPPVANPTRGPGRDGHAGRNNGEEGATHAALGRHRQPIARDGERHHRRGHIAPAPCPLLEPVQLQEILAPLELPGQVSMDALRGPHLSNLTGRREGGIRRHRGSSFGGSRMGNRGSADAAAKCGTPPPREGALRSVGSGCAEVIPWLERENAGTASSRHDGRRADGRIHRAQDQSFFLRRAG
mmetsp:Transcript_48749/g.156123  ORF Transcript_48749/g.156123 Transcript_48749/m.156123 type:complete len:376 (+) Transcript_48749:341-1468(+)